MSTVLVAEIGRPTGSPAARRMRREDHIPAVVYGQGMQPITISVVRRDLRVALSGSAGVNTVLDLTVDGKVYPAIVKELQRHPVRRTVSHVDFLQVNLNEEITISTSARRHATFLTRS
jgi:large subunit ribosomal protein L25